MEMIMKVCSLKQINRNNILVDCYWFYADALVIAQQIDKDINWMLNNFISLLAAEPDWVDFRSLGSDNMLTVCSCPFFDFQRINKSENDTIMGIDILNFVKQQIDLGKVLIIMVDRFFIKSYGFQNKAHNHELMFYGYDDEESMLYYCDHDITGLYRTDMCCTYAEFAEAYHNFEESPYLPEYEFTNNICVIEPLASRKYDLNIESIKTALKLYINPPSLCYLDCDRAGLKKDRQIYDLFCTYYNNVVNNDLSFNNRIQEIHLLYNHKRVMNYRIKHFVKNRLIEDLPDLSLYDSVEHNILKVRNLILKYRITRTDKILLTCNEYLKKTEELEISILEKFLALL